MPVRVRPCESIARRSAIAEGFASLRVFRKGCVYVRSPERGSATGCDRGGEKGRSPSPRHRVAGKSRFSYQQQYYLSCLLGVASQLKMLLLLPKSVPSLACMLPRTRLICTCAIPNTVRVWFQHAPACIPQVCLVRRIAERESTEELSFRRGTCRALEREIFTMFPDKTRASCR